MNDHGDDRSDEELLRIARAAPADGVGRRAASQLLGRYRARVYGWCRRYVRDPERALDTSQEVLLLAYRALEGFEGRAPFSAWLFVITRRHCIRAVRPRRLLRDEGADLECVADPRPGPEELVQESEEHEHLLRLVRERLEPIEQEAVWMRYVEQATVADITRTLGIGSASGARGLLQKARRKLRAAVARAGRAGEGERG
jgi:RNA polymerase sigma factor (sigma-70 family)